VTSPPSVSATERATSSHAAGLRVEEGAVERGDEIISHGASPHQHLAQRDHD
jgi:hypothetical protein